jgi:type I restriction enzyme S subunit
MIEVLQLKDIATKIGSGSTPTGGNESYKTSGISLIRSMNVYDFVFEYNGLAFIDDEQANKLKNVTVETNDILLNITGASVARCCMVPDDVLPARVNQHVSIIRVDRFKANPQYVLFFLNSPSYKSYLLGLSASGATREALTKEAIEGLKIPLPPLPIQTKIASILSAYDELIENNKQRIKLLEEMAEEIYKEWFVRFRFPGYESTKFFNEQGKEVPHGTVGALPEGWENSRLQSVCEFQMGQSPPSEFYNEEEIGLPFHQGVTNFNDRFPNHITYCTDLKRIANEGEILLSVRAPVGRINIATTQLVIGRGLCSVTHKGKLDNYCYYLLKDVFREEDSFGNGAVFNAVSKNDLLRIKTIRPTIEVAKKFQEFVKPMDDEIRILSDKNQLLQQTRDLLLPRLISGKLSVAHLIDEESEPLAMAAEPEGSYGNNRRQVTAAKR